jgi:hypothetical protein
MEPSNVYSSLRGGHHRCCCPRGHRARRSASGASLVARAHCERTERGAQPYTGDRRSAGCDGTGGTRRTRASSPRDVQSRRGHVSCDPEQIRQTPFEREHVAGLKALLDVRERELNKDLNEHRLKDQGAGGHRPQFRVGNGWLEVKWIPRNSGKLCGPYLYYRVREAGHLRSRYIGRAST